MKPLPKGNLKRTKGEYNMPEIKHAACQNSGSNPTIVNWERSSCGKNI
jgi:hypothetical protein